MVSKERELRILWRSVLLELGSCVDPGTSELLRMYLMAGSERKFKRCGPMSALTENLGCVWMQASRFAKEVFRLKPVGKMDMVMV